VRTRTAFISHEHAYSLGTVEDSGHPYLSIPVTFGAIDTSELYGISPDELERFQADPVAAAAFAAECRQHLHDDRRLGTPGWRRGTPIEPAPAGAPARAPITISAPREGARTIRGAQPPVGTWFAEGDDAPDLVPARPHLRRLGGDDPRIQAVAAAARSGDLDGRAVLVDLVHDRDESLAVRLEAQRLLVLLARERDLADATTFAYLDDAPDEMVEEFAGSGKLLLARSGVQWLIRVGREGWRDQDVRRRVIPSLLMLVDPGDPSQEPTLVQLAKRATSTFEQTTAEYLLSGEPWSPATIVERMRSAALASHAKGALYSNWFLAADLAVWSGIGGPYLRDALLTDDDLAAVLAWADALDALPWVPGRKYFHGHDVDGGSSLR
jgi:hypothetical protein